MIEIKLIKAFGTWMELKVKTAKKGYEVEVINSTRNKKEALEHFKLTNYVLAKSQEKLNSVINEMNSLKGRLNK